MAHFRSFYQLASLALLSVGAFCVVPASEAAASTIVTVQADGGATPPAKRAPSQDMIPPAPGTPGVDLEGKSEGKPGSKSTDRMPGKPKLASKPPLDPKKPEDRAKLLADLYQKLKTAKTAKDAKGHQNAIERLWLHSGSATVDVLMRRSTQALGQRKKKLALKLLDKVVDLDPKYVEGWNRRAFLNYADKRYGDALVDLQHVLSIDPNHFKAVEGLVSLMSQLNDKEGQLEALKILLKIHPHWPKADKMMETLRREVEGQPL